MMFSARQKIFFVIGLVAMVCMVFLSLYGDGGFYDLRRLQDKGDRMVQENNRLEEENRRLLRQVNRLKTDPEYVEDMARKDLGMVGEDEMVFTFEDADGE